MGIKNNYFKHFIVGLLYLLSASVWANTHIQDNSQTLTSKDESTLEKMLIDFEAQQRIHVEIVILPNFTDRSAMAANEFYFQQMAQDSSTIENRMLLLISIKDNYINILTTPSLAPIYTPIVVNEIIGSVAKKMQTKDYEGAIKIGASTITKYPSFKTASTKSSFFGMGSILFIVILVIALAIIVSIFKKRKP